MIKVGFIVGGKSNVKSVMEMHSQFRKSSIIISAIDITGEDIDAVLDSSERLDFLFLDRNSTISTRLKLIRKIHRLRCNLILFKSSSDIKKTKFYNLYSHNQENLETLNSVLEDRYNTKLRKVCTSKENKAKYKIYLFKEFFKDVQIRWSRRLYLAYV